MGRHRGCQEHIDVPNQTAYTDPDKHHSYRQMPPRSDDLFGEISSSSLTIH